MMKIPSYVTHLCFSLLVGLQLVTSSLSEQPPTTSLLPAFQALWESKQADRSVASQPRVGIQVGHWQHDQVPLELFRLKENSGAQADNGHTEVASNLAIAQAVADELRATGVIVDLLPATVPPGYKADAFITIHADGSYDDSISGYKVASSAKDRTGQALSLAYFVDQAYSSSTGLDKHHIITRNMTHYYAFAYDRFLHSVSTQTPSIIIETGFITSPADQEILVHQPTIAAEGISQGITTYLEFKEKNLALNKTSLSKST